MNDLDFLIRGGLIYDGSLKEPFFADIVISGNRIYLQRKGQTDCKYNVIEAEGLSVAPGFIDAHAHSDFTLLADPRAEGKILQGVTTEINGNCGLSAAPLLKKALERREGDLAELGIRDRWQSLSDYCRIIERNGIAVNSAMLVGHGNIRGSVVGYDDRRPSVSEMADMKGLLQETIREGAIGLSTGLIYPPGLFAGTEELVSLAAVIHEHDLTFTSHMRSEGSRLIESVQEVLQIGRQSGVDVHISHIKTAGKENWNKAGRVISLLVEAVESGMSVTCDRYPYIASNTDLDAILPAWTYDGGNEAELKRLENVDTRNRIREDMQEQLSEEDYWDCIIISSIESEKNRWMEGRTLAEISRLLGRECLDAVFSILQEEKLRVGAIFLSMSEQNMMKFMSLPFCMIGSDASARCYDGITRKGKPHPRTFGTFPRFIGKYAIQEKIISITEAVHKATMLPARTFKLSGRGHISDGMYADIVIFDERKIIDRATFENPFVKPEGISYVFVNGIASVWEGEVTGKRAGRILKNS